MLSIIALAFYLAAALWLAASAYRSAGHPAVGSRAAGLTLGVVALGVHAAQLWFSVLRTTQLALTAADTASLIGWVIAIIAIIAAWRKPSYTGASAVLLAIAGVVAAITNEGTRDFPVASRGWELTAHIVLSTLAYALETVGAALAIALALLDRRLRSRQPLGWLSVLPPVESLEAGVFQAMGAGFAVLSLALFSGFFFVDDFLAQHLVHKAVLSCFAWLIFGILLFGRWRFGWRGRTALRWILGGFIVLGLAYFGSKFVLEVVLGRHWG